MLCETVLCIAVCIQNKTGMSFNAESKQKQCSLDTLLLLLLVLQARYLFLSISLLWH
jgi:hypothetical protein